MTSACPILARTVVGVLVLAISASGVVAQGKSWCCFLLHRSATASECCQGCHVSHAQHIAERATSCCRERASVPQQAQPVCECQAVTLEWAAVVSQSWQADSFVPHFTAFAPQPTVLHGSSAQERSAVPPDVPVRVLFCTWLI